MLEPLNTSLAGRYRLLDTLGAGGMATVYRAEDLRHHREVAIKVLHPELAASMGADRFLSEIRTTARLAHPHILALHDSGAEGGFLYYVMPLVAGDSLRAKMDQVGQFAVVEAVRLILQVADALTYAHAQQVIHRDIKPENILLQGGHALVADFGIARALSAAGGERITLTGMALGTPAYMSPEQAAGEQQVDGRTDIYALACVLYEMLAGEPPFRAANPAALMAAKFVREAPRITIKRPAVPRPLVAALARALAREPGDRFASMAEFAAALSAQEAPAHDGVGRSIAVLAFANMSDDPETEYFSDGISEEIINVLVQIPNFRVAARTSSFSFKGKNEDLRSIGSQLGVATVLEGSVRRAGSRLRITAQLINVADGLHLWSERFDREMTDVFAIQDEISAAIAEKLKVTLGADNDASPKAAPLTSSLEAYELFLKGRALEHRRGPGLRTAVTLYEQAVALDPEFGAAHAALAHALVLTGFYGIYTSNQIGDRARAAAQNAIAAAPGLGQSHRAVAMVAQLLDKDRERAERAWAIAMELSPSDTTVKMEHAFYLLCGVKGDFVRAEEETRQALTQDPLSALAQAFRALVFGYADRHADTVAAARRGLELDPSSFICFYQLGLGLVRMGEYDRAITAVEPILAPSGRHPWIMLVLALAHYRAGRTTEAEALWEELVTRSRSDYVQPALLLLVANGMQRHEDVAQLLSAPAMENDMTIPVLFLYFTENRGLSRLPEGKALLARMGWHDEVARLS